MGAASPPVPAEERWPGAARIAAGPFLEILLLAALAALFGREYLSLHSLVIPSGPEFVSSIQTHQLWSQLSDCGGCAMWYGQLRGGFPLFAEPTGAQLNPLVAVSTLLFGLLGGAKVAVVVALFLAGLSAWWLCRELELSRAARLFGGCLGVVAGSVAPRLHGGHFSVAISIAFACLVPAALVALSRRPTGASAAALAAVLACVGVSGAGYIQVALVGAMLSALLLVPSGGARRFLGWLAVSGLLAAVLAAPLLLPFARFSAEISKDVDATFKTGRPIALQLLSFVVGDRAFYAASVFDPTISPAATANFVGWIPLGLAIWGLDARRRESRFLFTFAFLSLWMASGQPLQLLIALFRSPAVTSFLGGVRYVPFMSALAAPAVVGLAALGVDRLLAVPWPRWSPFPRFDTRWLLAAPLLVSLHAAFSFNRQFLKTRMEDPYSSAVVAALRTPDLQWVATDHQDHWVAPMLRNGFKQARDFFHTWRYKGRPDPEPYLDAIRGLVPPPGTLVVADLYGVRVVKTPGREYARVEHADGTATVARATGRGGDVDVTVDAPAPGRLVVEENALDGWKASVNGASRPLEPGRWLTVAIPAGHSLVAFRYRPWDVPAGLALFAAGLLVTLALWLRVIPFERATRRAERRAE